MCLWSSLFSIAVIRLSVLCYFVCVLLSSMAFVEDVVASRESVATPTAAQVRAVAVVDAYKWTLTRTETRSSETRTMYRYYVPVCGAKRRFIDIS